MLLGILALTWAVQADSFFFVGMFERAVNRAVRHLAPARHHTRNVRQLGLPLRGTVVVVQHATDPLTRRTDR
jgi:hypothetical protein